MTPPDPRLWLLSCADKLASQSKLPIDTAGIARRLDVRVRCEDLHLAKHDGEVRRTSSGKYEITVRKGDPAPRRRFTLAHELAHVLLDKRFSLRANSKREYWEHEQWCNEFAGRLLVPSAILDTAVLETPRAALNTLWRLRAVCQVSPETAARRIVQHSSSVAYLAVRRTMNAEGDTVFEVTWRASSLGAAPTPNRGSHLLPGDPLRNALTGRATHFNLVPDIIGATSRARDQVTACLLSSRGATIRGLTTQQ